MSDVKTALILEGIAQRIEEVIIPRVIESIFTGDTEVVFVSSEFVWVGEGEEPEHKKQGIGALLKGLSRDYELVPETKEKFVAEIVLSDLRDEIMNIAERISGDNPILYDSDKFGVIGGDTDD